MFTIGRSQHSLIKSSEFSCSSLYLHCASLGAVCRVQDYVENKEKKNLVSLLDWWLSYHMSLFPTPDKTGRQLFASYWGVIYL